MQSLISKRTGRFTVILSAASMSLLLVGAGCNDKSAMDANVSVTPDMPINAGVSADMGMNADAMPAGDAMAPKDDMAMDAPKDTMVAHTYKDGTYKSVGKYMSPAGAESINVTITLKDDVIVDADVHSNATVAKSKMMQGQFIGGYKAMVIGKNISEVNLGKVSGSSLTPKGFNDALASIKAQAKI